MVTALTRLIPLLVALPWLAGGDAAARGREPGWSPVIIATGEQREQIQATPIQQRPYRPLHVYGNTVRRMYYRGAPLPRPGEVIALPLRIVARR